MEVKQATHARLVVFADRFNLPLEFVIETFLVQALEALEEDEHIIWPIRFNVNED